MHFCDACVTYTEMFSFCHDLRVNWFLLFVINFLRITSSNLNSYPAFLFFTLSIPLSYREPSAWNPSFFSLFQVFAGNKDRNTIVEHLLVTAFNARFIRFHPKTYSSHTCMRAEVYGCRNGMFLCLVWLMVKLLSDWRDYLLCTCLNNKY